jgi:hypothetical protein
MKLFFLTIAAIFGIVLCNKAQEPERTASKIPQSNLGLLLETRRFGYSRFRNSLSGSQPARPQRQCIQRNFGMENSKLIRFLA